MPHLHASQSCLIRRSAIATHPSTTAQIVHPHLPPQPTPSALPASLYPPSLESADSHPAPVAATPCCSPAPPTSHAAQSATCSAPAARAGEDRSAQKDLA